jgi:hypothetical protein
VLLAALGAVALAGCADCRYDRRGMTVCEPPTAQPAGRAPARIASAVPPAAHERSAQKPPLPERVITAEKRVIAAENETRFVVLPDTEVVGRSRTYTGGQSDPDSCARQCLASKGCDAFAFSKETKVCYLVAQITQSNPDSSFVSGQLR